MNLFGDFLESLAGRAGQSSMRVLIGRADSVADPLSVGGQNAATGVRACVQLREDAGSTAAAAAAEEASAFSNMLQ